MREEFGAPASAIVKLEAELVGAGGRLARGDQAAALHPRLLVPARRAQAARFGVPGVLGILLIGLALFSSWLVGLADWTEILLFFLGLGLIGVEALGFLPRHRRLRPARVRLARARADPLAAEFPVPRERDAGRDPDGQPARPALADPPAHGGLGPALATPAAPALRQPRLARAARAGWHRCLDALRDGRRRARHARRRVRHDAQAELRPAGVLELDDGSRHDVVSQGAFVERGRACA